MEERAEQYTFSVWPNNSKRELVSLAYRDVSDKIKAAYLAGAAEREARIAVLEQALGEMYDVFHTMNPDPTQAMTALEDALSALTGFSGGGKG